MVLCRLELAKQGDRMKKGGRLGWVLREDTCERGGADFIRPKVMSIELATGDNRAKHSYFYFCLLSISRFSHRLLINFLTYWGCYIQGGNRWEWTPQSRLFQAHYSLRLSHALLSWALFSQYCRANDDFNVWRLFHCFSFDSHLVAKNDEIKAPKG